ncbi:MAG: carbohydrate-binding domain-containing protein [Leucobacter sp.]
MKYRTPLIASLALSVALLTGCSSTASPLSASDSATVVTTQSESGSGSDSADSGSTEESSTAASAFTGDLSPQEVLNANADYTTVNEDEWSESDAIDVSLSGSTAKVASGTEGVTVSGSTVTIDAAGVYRLSGSLDGQVVVAAPNDAQVVLLLDGASIDNGEGPAIEVQTADDVAIHLADGSENSVSDASSYAEDATANAAIDARADLTISGSGSLTVQGNGNDGISSTDDLVILGGDITVTAADDALRGKDALVIEGGTLALTATGGDGLKSDQEDDDTRGYILVSGGTIDITAGDDGLQAQTDTVVTGGSITAAVADDGVKGEVTVSIAGGEITVTESTEAVEAANIAIFDGVIDLNASDDGINASGLNDGSQDREADSGERLEISGGTITVKATADGLDSNGTVTVSGGDITITSAQNGGDGPVDANGEITVTGGTIMANGSEWDAASAQQGPGGMPGGGTGGGPGRMPN